MVEDVVMAIKLTREMAMAAATAAANLAMKAAGRSCWNAEDFEAFAEEFNRLWPLERDLDG